MVELDIVAFRLLLYPFPVFINICGIDNEEEFVFAAFVNQQVVHHTAILVTHHTIENFSCRHTCDVVGEDMVDVTLGIRACDEYFTHMTHIEHATRLAYSLMFVYNATILDRHLETAKGRHQSSQGYVFVIETGLFVFHKHLDFIPLIILQNLPS